MRRICCPILLLVMFMGGPQPLAAASLQDAVKSVQPSPAGVAATTVSTATPPPAAPLPAAPARSALLNRDVVEMVRAGLSHEIILAKIKASDCAFETSVAGLEKLKADGVPDTLILSMVIASKDDSAHARAGHVAREATTPPLERTAVRVPTGTRVEVETAYTVSSQEVREGDVISFRVVNPVIVGGVEVISPGATATARVVKATRGGHFGRAGRLAWTMYEVTAVDGTRVPIQFLGREVGDSKGAKVATHTIVMGALLGPAAPLALLHGFKRGGNAVMPEGKRFDVLVHADTTVQAVSKPK